MVKLFADDPECRLYNFVVARTGRCQQMLFNGFIICTEIFTIIIHTFNWYRRLLS